MKPWLWGVLGVTAPVVLSFAWATYPWNLFPKTRQGEIGSVPGAASAPERPTTLTLLTWNIAWAYGPGSEGTDDYVPKDPAHFRRHLEGIATAIRASGADVVLLQEIDYGAARSHGQDQLVELARLTGLSHWARAESWRANYIPFPFSPWSRHFGRMRSGGGVISRWPLTANKVDLLQKPLNKSWWYNLFYLYRYFQTVEMRIGERHVRLINLHLEAFDQETKMSQARQLLAKAKNEKLDFVGGDFNMLPEAAMKRSGFSNPEDRYEADATPRILAEMPLKEVVEPAVYARREEAWFTYPSVRPDRRLDYIYYGKRWVPMRSEVVNGTDPGVSDHLPLKAVFQFFEPEFIRD